MRNVKLKTALGLLLVMFAGFAPVAQGEGLSISGPRGFVLRNSPFGSGKLKFSRVSKNLVSLGKRLYEIDRNGKVRPLYLNKKTGQLFNATEKATAMQMANLYADRFYNFGSKWSPLIRKFLANMGMSPRIKAVAAQPSLEPNNFFVLDPRKNNSNLNQRLPKTSPSASHVSSEDGFSSFFLSRPRSTSSASVVPVQACRNLNGAICGRDKARSNQLKAAESFKTGMIRRFLSETGMKFTDFRTIIRSPFKFQRGIMAFFTFLNRQSDGLGPLVDRVRAAMVGSISAQPLSEEAKRVMIDRVSAIQVKTLPNKNDYASILAFFENCGPDGMTEGAFAVPPLGEVVICPGLFLSAVAKGGDMMGHLSHVISHEMGHHIGNDVNPFTGSRGPFDPFYQSYGSCLVKRFNGVDPSHIGESVADFWGVSALAAQLPGKGRGEAFLFLKNAFQPLCSSPNDGVHPSGAFRINIILGRHPEVRRAIGCPVNSEERPACTLEGEVTQ